MSIPYALFAERYGVALMRHNGSDWDFVAWAKNGFTFVEELGPGNYVYQLWHVVGAKFNVIYGTSPYPFTSSTLEGNTRLSVMRAKK